MKWKFDGSAFFASFCDLLPDLDPRGGTLEGEIGLDIGTLSCYQQEFLQDDGSSRKFPIPKL